MCEAAHGGMIACCNNAQTTNTNSVLAIADRLGVNQALGD